MATRSLDEQRKAFAAEHGREHAPSTLSDEDLAESLRIQARANREHPPPWKELRLRNQADGSLVVHAVRREASPKPIVHVRPRRASRPRGRRARRTSRSRDGPGLGDDSDKPPEHLERLRPLTSVARAYLRAQVDLLRREAVAARPEVTPEVFHLFDEDRRS